MDFYKQSAGHSSFFVFENNFLSRAISRQAPVTHVSQPRSVTAPATAPAPAPLQRLLLFPLPRLVWVSLTFWQLGNWQSFSAWHARHVDKRRQRCQQRHRRIYANQLGCHALEPRSPEPWMSVLLDLAPRVVRPFRGKLGHGKLIWLSGMMRLHRQLRSPTAERVGFVCQ